MIKTPSDTDGLTASRGEDSVVVLGSQIFVTLVTLGTQSLLAWGLAPQGRGAYAVCLVFSMLLGVFFIMGCDRASQHFTMSGGLSLSQSVSVALTCTAVGSFFGMVAGWFLADLPFTFFANADIAQFRLSLPLVPLIILFVVFQLQFAGLRRFVRLGVFSLIQVAANLVFLAIALLGFEAGVSGALLAYECSLVLVIVLFIRDLQRHCDLVLRLPAWLQIRPVLFYGMRYFGARFGTLLDNQIGVLFLSILATRDEIGLFAAVVTLALRICIIPQSIESAILPRLSADPQGQHALLGRAVRISSCLTGAAVVGLMLISVPLIPFLFSPAFSAAIPIIWILGPGILFQGVAMILMAHFRAVDRPGINSWVIWLALAVNIAVVLTFYPFMGFSAAAWAMTAGFAVRMLALLGLYARTTDGTIRDLFRFNAGDVASIRDTTTQIASRIGLTGKRGAA